ncbi:HNH endonuclease signature motif containing protein [Williamsia sp. 1135]|uniref:HNH endonuclease n=1 Tax=Williamsia sp. 1135 TaxID=1889262 RepID=UPI000A0FD7A8|nr:HNH endonuclease signature motif containing protein [Williamsia sp. 1135]ORM32494.1 HNH endonuclease [Williamsia sp. 1135]
MRVLDSVAAVTELVVPGDSSELLMLVRDLITLRNATEHQLAVCAAVLDELGVARQAGSTTSKLLEANGAAPASAQRWVRIGAGLAGLDRTVGWARDGYLSSEHVDAIVKGLAGIDGRSEQPVTDAKRYGFEGELLNGAVSGAPPSEISKTARSLGNEFAADTGGKPPAEDPSLNSLDYAVSGEGRCVGKFDLDVKIGEKLFSALDFWSKPRPEPDGSPDARTPTQLRADALHQLLDCGGGGQGLISAPRTEVNVTVPADHPDQASLRWMGPITEATAAALACDSTFTFITLDGQQVPIDLSPPKRLFTGPVRKAIIIRDECCIKCGAPATWTDAHHIKHYIDGGETTLANGCLLCRTCHGAVHNTGWDVIMGSDGHPWLIPPVEMDPHQRPLPAYNRRTMTLAA